MHTNYLEAQTRARDERQLHKQSDVLQQKSAHKLVKPSRHLSCGNHKGAWPQTFSRRSTTYWLSSCMESRIKIPWVDAVEYCLNIENFVRPLMFSDTDILDLCEQTVGCSELKYVHSKDNVSCYTWRLMIDDLHYYMNLGFCNHYTPVTTFPNVGYVIIIYNNIHTHVYS